MSRNFNIMQKMKNSNRTQKILMTACCVLMLIFITGIMRNFYLDSASNLLIKTSLLNKKYINDAQSISLQYRGQNFTLERDGVLLITDENNTVRLKADKKITENYFQSFTNVINLYEKKDSVYKNNFTFFLQIRLADDTLVLDLSLTEPDFSGNKIILLNNLSGKIYKAKDDYTEIFDSFLETFCSKNFFSQDFIENPDSIVQIKTMDFTAQDAIPVEKIYVRGQKGFDEKISTVLFQQSSKIVSLFFENSVEYDCKLIFQIELQDEYQQCSTIQVLYGNKRYYCRPLDGFDGIFEISLWTANKLCFGILKNY